MGLPRGAGPGGEDGPGRGQDGGLCHWPLHCAWTMIAHAIRTACHVDRGLTMSEPEHNPIRNKQMKPPMLNPLVRRVMPSGDIKWILVAVGLAVAVGLLALLLGTRL